MADAYLPARSSFVAAVTSSGTVYAGTWPNLLRCDDIMIPEPYHMATHPRLPLIYATSGRTTGRLFVLRREGSLLRVVRVVDRLGEFPCHVAVAPDGTAVAVTDFARGGIVLLDLDQFGLPETHIASPHLGTYTHATAFLSDGNLATTVMGDDCVKILCREANALSVARTIQLPVGSGPRHLTSPDGEELWVVCESTSTVVRLSGAGTTDVFPASSASTDSGADIGVVGADHLVASTRGSGLITVIARHSKVVTSTTQVGEWPISIAIPGDGSAFVGDTRLGEVRRIWIDGSGVAHSDDHRVWLPEPLSIVARP